MKDNLNTVEFVINPYLFILRSFNISHLQEKCHFSYNITRNSIMLVQKYTVNTLIFYNLIVKNITKYFPKIYSSAATGLILCYLNTSFENVQRLYSESLRQNIL